MTLLTLIVRTDYGVVRFYPGNQTAQLLLQLTGKKCFSKADLPVLKKLNYTAELVTPAEAAINSLA